MKVLLGPLFTALLIMPFALGGQQDITTAPVQVAPDKKCPEGCECEKCKAPEKCKEGCECKKCTKKKAEDADKDEALLACKKCAKHNKKKDGDDEDHEHDDDKKEGLLLVA